MKDFDEPGHLAPTGLFIAGAKYMVIQGEPNAVIRGKKVYVTHWINITSWWHVLVAYMHACSNNVIYLLVWFEYMIIGSRRDNHKENRTVMCVWDLRRASDTRTMQHGRREVGWLPPRTGPLDSSILVTENVARDLHFLYAHCFSFCLFGFFAFLFFFFGSHA